jgi:Kinesin motor domain
MVITIRFNNLFDWVYLKIAVGKDTCNPRGAWHCDSVALPRSTSNYFTAPLNHSVETDSMNLYVKYLLKKIITWTGGVLSIVDLAGSERARNVKTTGSTLAEAGKINESLMYLGQCLQVQSEQHDGSKPIVPFRQCKLTELLFSNSYSAGSSHASRAPQKAIMIVTADPQGDFNATSLILRY